MPGGPLDSAEIIAAFLQFKRHNQGRSARTEIAYGAVLERLVLFLAGREPPVNSLGDATEDDLVMFCGPWLHKQGLEALARRPYVAAVRELYKWLRRTRRVAHNVAAGITYPKTGLKLPTAITLKNAERLMWAPDFGTFDGIRDAAMMGVLLGCGLRVSGLVRLNQGHLAHTEHDGETRMVLRVTEKGEKERLVPVPKETEMLLRVYLEHAQLAAIDRTLKDGDQVLFVSTMNRRVPAHEYIGERRRLSRWAVNDLIHRHGKKAGVPIKELHPHALRHLFGTELAESNIDLILRQELLGHAHAKDTKLYDQMAMRRKVKASDLGTPMAKIRTPVTDLIKQLAASRPKPA